MSRIAQGGLLKRISSPFKGTFQSSNLFNSAQFKGSAQSASSIVRTSSIEFKRGYNIGPSRRYGLHEVLINKNLTKQTISNLRNLNHKRLNSSSTSSSSAKAKANNKKPKESIFSKLKRASTFMISTAAVIGASGLAIIVIYLLLAEIAFPSGDTQTFNRAVKLIEQDETAQKLMSFENGERLKAFGENSGDKWTRNRPISSVRRPGLDGKEHVLMRFNVQSKTKTATVQLEAVDESFWKQEFAYVILDVPGENRHYIIKPKAPENRFLIKNKDTGFLGVKWGPRKD